MKIAALEEANQALADCLVYHCIPLHFRNTVNSDATSTPTRLRPTEEGDLEATIQASEGQQEAGSSQSPQQATVDLQAEPKRAEISLEKPLEPAKPRRGPSRPKSSKIKSKNQTPSTVQAGNQR